MATSMVNPRVEINSVDQSANVVECVLDISADELEDTAFGDTARSRIGGLKDGSLKLKFNADFAAGSLDATLFALLGTVVTFKVRASSSAVSTSNPEYQGSILVTQWTPVNGAVGDLATVDVSFPTTGAITRATA